MRRDKWGWGVNVLVHVHVGSGVVVVGGRRTGDDARLGGDAAPTIQGKDNLLDPGHFLLLFWHVGIITESTKQCRGWSHTTNPKRWRDAGGICLVG